MNIRTRATGLTIALVLASGLGSVAVGAGTAVAAGPCWKSNGKWWCHNRVPAPVHDGGGVVDHVRTNPSVFLCRAELGRHGVGPHPNRWVATQGDDHKAWGWVKDGDIASETDPLPICVW